MSEEDSAGGNTRPDQSDNRSVHSMEMGTRASVHQRAAPFRYPSSDHGAYSDNVSLHEASSPEDEVIQKPLRGDGWTEDRSVGRHIGTLGVAALIMNKMIGTGIFTTPGTILFLTGSKSISIVLWIIGGIYSMLRCVGPMSAMHMIKLDVC